MALVSTWTAELAGATEATAPPPALPRYALTPGQELTYRSVFSTKYWKGDRTGLVSDRIDVTVWIIRANPDGSRRLVFRQRDATTRVRGGTKHEEPPSTQIVYADIFPDGRELPNQSLNFCYMPAVLFPPLPSNAAEAAAGWSRTEQDLQFACKLVPSASDFIFSATLQNSLAKIYLDSHTSRYTFDTNRGLIARSEDSWTRESSIKGSGGGTIELLGARAMEPDALKQLADDADRYFAALDAYTARLEAASRATPDDAARMLPLALAELKSAAAGLRQPDLKADAIQHIREHEARAGDALKNASDRAGRIGKPAPVFETTDIDGNQVRLADLRGKVVVLDFWYRGWGWCIRSMPQMNQVVADFAGRPVAMFGMNTDRDPADAGFVAGKMQLKYPTLKAEHLAEKFGVEGFPTLIVIDRTGAVRDIRTGYSPNLRQELGAVIRELLAQK